MISPSHVAIIMDGNGRWAQQRGRDRTFGHIKGARAAKRIVEHAAELGLKHLTLYAFSTENWLRPYAEVSFLMRLLAKNLKRERKNLMKNNIRFHAIGEWSRIPTAVIREVEQSIRETAGNTGMTLTFALSYGGRLEIVMAARSLAEKVKSGEITSEEITEDVFSQYLQTYPQPDPDLVIRTSGEARISNFLTWQSAYSEIFVTPTMWPDFTEDSFNEALFCFSKRQRRFGKTQCQVDNSSQTPSLFNAEAK